MTSIPAKESARLIIPLWGSVYAKKLTSMTLPALLAPNNLPALCEMFDVEVVIVTERKLFETIRQSQSHQKLSKLCQTKFASLDDLMSGISGDYGVVLTEALFRGFVDLGEKMTETYLLFLNADFIIADGSYRRLGELMLEGKRVIHAPSFRAVLEDVWPKLQERVQGTTLAVSPREMVKLALAHRHITVNARIVNQRLYHQWRMDQFYWYVNDDTLIGYQWPVALVAIKPERVITEPVLVWDYGFIPEAAPTLDKYFIHDSDEFFMLEPQKRSSGDEMIRLGAISVENIAKDLSVWTTREQRECGTQLFKIHASELPLDLDRTIAESRQYMNEIVRRLSQKPQPHVGHGMLGAWFDETRARIRSQPNKVPQLELLEGDVLPGSRPPISENLQGDNSRGVWLTARHRISDALLSMLRKLNRRMFGSLSGIRIWHPLWLDLHEMAVNLEKLRRVKGTQILWLTSRDSFFRNSTVRQDDAAAFMTVMDEDAEVGGRGYDACFCELVPSEITNLQNLFRKIRGQVRAGGAIFIHVYNGNDMPFGTGIFTPFDKIFPDSDISSIQFYGSATSARIRRLYFGVARSNHRYPLVRGILTGMFLVLLAPFVWLVNSRAARRDPHVYSPNWTSVIVKFTVNHYASATGKNYAADGEEHQGLAVKSAAARKNR